MPAINQRIGEYILTRQIGQGTFGEVWLAHHHAWAQKLAAVKIPTDPQYMRDLQKEGEAVHELDHPNIVRAIAFDPYADPPYLVMEYVPGQSLRSLIQQGPLRPDDAVAVMRQVLAALDHAHRAGVIHRDVKPENILIDERSHTEGLAAHGVVKLTDFGLGKVPAHASQSILMSQEGDQPEKISGTQHYIAPEQFDGAPSDVRSDLYACGVVLFEMLTGNRPVGTDIPSEASAGVPAYLDEAYRHAVARHDRRFASAQELLAALDEPQAEQPKADTTPNTKQQKEKAPLMEAASSNPNPEVIAMLVKAGADVNMKDENNKTPLMEAASSNPNPDVIAMLVKAGADVNAKDNSADTPLMWAANHNPNREVIRALLKAGADANAKKKFSWMPRIFAVLLKARADVNAKDDLGRTPLMCAAMRNPNPDVIKVLLKAGANVNVKDEYGQTPLMGAAEYNPNPNIVVALLQSGANVNAKNTWGKTPLICAAEADVPNPDVIMALLKAGADVNGKNERGKTPLMEAAKNPNLHGLAALLKAGADVGAKDILMVPQPVSFWTFPTRYRDHGHF